MAIHTEWQYTQSTNDIYNPLIDWYNIQPNTQSADWYYKIPHWLYTITHFTGNIQPNIQFPLILQNHSLAIYTDNILYTVSLILYVHCAMTGIINYLPQYWKNTQLVQYTQMYNIYTHSLLTIRHVYKINVFLIFNSPFSSPLIGRRVIGRPISMLLYQLQCFNRILISLTLWNGYSKYKSEGLRFRNLLQNLIQVTFFLGLD